MPYGRPAVGYSVIFPVRVSRRPMRLPRCTVNQITPCPSVTSVCGSPPDGALYSTTLPVDGSSRPMVPLPFPVKRRRIEPADGAVAVSRVPDMAARVHEQAVRLRPLREIPLCEGLRAGVEARNLIPGHHRDVNVAVRSRSGVTREAGCGHRPFRDLALDGRFRPWRDPVVRPPGPSGLTHDEDERPDKNACAVSH